MPDAAARALERFGHAGKNFLVTGGSEGIGRALIEEVAAMGAKVYTCCRTQDKLDAVLADWQAQGLDVHGCTADVSNSDARQRLVDAARSHFDGVLHVLVNNVGTNKRGEVVDYSSEDFESLICVNLQSAFGLTQLCHGMLKAARGGAVVFNTSVAGGPLAMTSTAIYGMAKAALNQLTRNLACEWGRDHIRVNAVAPYYIATPRLEPLLADEEYTRKVVERCPLGRVGEAQDVAGLMAFLASPAAAYVSGQVIAVDGGYSIMGLYP